MEITKEQTEQIKKFCTGFYNKLDFAHNVEHMNRTIKIAKFIAKKENANLEIVKLGAMVHQFHDNVDELKKFLEDIDLEPKLIEKLVECAEFRPFKNTSKKQATLEAKVVFDADALQVLGPQGIIREITCNIKTRNKRLHKSVQDARNIENSFYKTLQTETARNMIREIHELMKKFWQIYDNWEKSFLQARSPIEHNY
jgi:uncharacterized protein